VELLISMGAGVLICGGIASFMLFSAKSFQAMSNYADLDTYARLALDKMTQKIRQANGVSTCTSNTLVLVDSDGGALTYAYNASDKTLTETKGSSSHVLLRDCEGLNFSIYQRNPISGTYDQYPAASAGTCKLVSIQWVCAKSILGDIRNSESVQTAKIVIRKQ
jgi:Tfp pilus assembly protein PilW